MFPVREKCDGKSHTFLHARAHAGLTPVTYISTHRKYIQTPSTCEHTHGVHAHCVLHAYKTHTYTCVHVENTHIRLHACGPICIYSVYTVCIHAHMCASIRVCARIERPRSERSPAPSLRIPGRRRRSRAPSTGGPLPSPVLSPLDGCTQVTVGSRPLRQAWECPLESCWPGPPGGRGSAFTLQLSPLL